MLCAMNDYLIRVVDLTPELIAVKCETTQVIKQLYIEHMKCLIEVGSNFVPGRENILLQLSRIVLTSADLVVFSYHPRLLTSQLKYL